MTIIYLGIAWMVGIVLASQFSLPEELWSLIAVVSLIAAVLLRKSDRPKTLLLMLAFLCLGGLRLTLAETSVDQGEVAYFNGQDQVALTGMTIKDVDIRDKSQTLRIRAELIKLADGSAQEVDGKVLLTLPPLPAIEYGTRIRASGDLDEPVSGSEFDYKSYLARQGIHSVMKWPEIEVLAVEQGSPFFRLIYAIRGHAQRTINELLPEPQAALLSGILLGNDNGIPSDLAADFRETGMTHIIAISGFNIAILTGLLLAVSKPVFGPKRSGWFVLAGIFVYTILVGADAAVVRAAIMGALFVVAARLMGRPTYAPAGLFTAALVMTIINPNILWDVGFQLSFAATLGLMLYVGPMSDWTNARLQPKIGRENARKITRTLAEILFATMAALLLTLPIMLYHFGQLSLVSPVANLLILPAQPWVMVWGGLAALAGMVTPVLGQPIAWVAWLFLSYTIGLVRFLASFPSAAVQVRLSLTGILVFYGLVLGLTWIVFLKREQKTSMIEKIGKNISWSAALFALAAVALLTNIWAFSQPDGELHVAFLDVAQGDATFIQTPSGSQLLIDGGAYPSILKEQLGQLIPFWDKDIDLVIATHPDADHVEALPEVFEHYDVGHLITNGQTTGTSSYEALLALAQQKGTPVHSTSSGEVLVLDDGVRLEILNPNSYAQSTDGEKHDNEMSVVLRLTYADFSLLLTGDISEKTEAELTAVGSTLSAVVYKAGHHGARSSSSKALLDTVKPQFVIISAGEGNRYGHPHEAVLVRAATIRAEVLRTDERGTIEVTTDGQGMSWQTWD